MTKTIERRDEQTRQLVLTTLAACSGNSREAERRLAKLDITLDHSTIWEWGKKYAEDYQRIRSEMLPRLREEAADRHRALEQRQLEDSLAAADLIRGRMPKMEDRDLINAMGKLDIGSGIHAEKAQMYDGLPTHIVRRDATEILRELKSMGVEQIQDAEVVSEEDVSPSELGVSSAVSAIAVPAEATDVDA